MFKFIFIKKKSKKIQRKNQKCVKTKATIQFDDKFKTQIENQTQNSQTTFVVNVEIIT